MADRDYYFALEFEKYHLTRLKQVGDAVPGSHSENLEFAQQRAATMIRARLTAMIGASAATALHNTWVAEASTPAQVVPMVIRQVADLLGSAFVWAMEEAYQGATRREGRKRSEKTVSETLLLKAEEAWAEIVKTRHLMSLDGTIVDLNSYSGVGTGIGCASAEATFFPDLEETTSFDYYPAFSLEGAFRGMAN